MYLVQKVPNVYNKRMLAVKIGLFGFLLSSETPVWNYD